MTGFVPLPIVLPLFAAALSVVGGRSRNFQRILSLTTLVAILAVAVALLLEADDVGHIVHEAGGWRAPLGITLVVDRLSAILLVISAIVLLVVMVYAIGEAGEEADRVAFHPLYLVLAAGISASFITGDLFNLFVAFEMMLAASYVLITLGGRDDQVRSGMTYVVINLVASTLFITALALVYAATGTVSMADLAGRLDQLPDGVRASLAILFLVVFGMKAALFPLFSWLPDSYPTAPSPVTAVFAGLLTKVGVYAIIRSQTLLFAPTEWMGTVLLTVAVLTMIVGVLGAIAQDDVKRILAFHIVSQIGYMIFGLGLLTLAGIAGAIFYMVHHIAVKTTLFLAAGLIGRRAGSTRLSETGGLIRSAPAIAALFALPALGLGGIPPFSGFVAKLGLLQAGFADEAWLPSAVTLAVGLLTMYSMSKIWNGVFWGEPDEEPRHPPLLSGQDSKRTIIGMSGATLALGLVSIGIALSAGPLYELAERAAADVLDRSAYVDAVFGVSP